ncbi:hypothetical protein M514_10359 [Trichuris suis]|uniref:Uncharacterized protein n=1 Tax=Trichuris suis TaxID=68888 RepID=A0A085NEM4_9BILA|nr:hypothetical protein M514_10359 [Trichuris suis]
MVTKNLVNGLKQRGSVHDASPTGMHISTEGEELWKPLKAADDTRRLLPALLDNGFDKIDQFYEMKLAKIENREFDTVKEENLNVMSDGGGVQNPESRNPDRSKS